MTLIVGVATIWSFIHSKKVEDRLLQLEEFKYKPDIRVERDFTETTDCDNVFKEMCLAHVVNEGHKVVQLGDTLGLFHRKNISGMNYNDTRSYDFLKFYKSSDGKLPYLPDGAIEFDKVK